MSTAKIIIVSVIITLSVTVIVQSVRYGYHTEIVSEIDISESGRAWLTANFSEINICLDMDGGVSVCTDYWSRRGSDVWSFKAINGVTLDDSSIPTSKLKFTGFKTRMITGYPEPYGGMQARPNFDNFSKNINYSYRVRFSYEKNGKNHLDYYKVSFDIYKKLSTLDINNGVNLIVDMWYNSVNNINVVELN